MFNSLTYAKSPITAFSNGYPQLSPRPITAIVRLSTTAPITRKRMTPPLHFKIFASRCGSFYLQLGADKASFDKAKLISNLISGCRRKSFQTQI